MLRVPRALFSTGGVGRRVSLEFRLRTQLCDLRDGTTDHDVLMFDRELQRHARIIGHVEHRLRHLYRGNFPETQKCGEQGQLHHG